MQSSSRRARISVRVLTELLLAPLLGRALLPLLLLPCLAAAPLEAACCSPLKGAGSVRGAGSGLFASPTSIGSSAPGPLTLQHQHGQQPEGKTRL